MFLKCHTATEIISTTFCSPAPQPRCLLLPSLSPTSIVPQSWRRRSKFKLFTILWPHLFGDHCPEPLSSNEYNYLSWPRCCHSGMFNPKTEHFKNQAQGGQGLPGNGRLVPSWLLCGCTLGTCVTGCFAIFHGSAYVLFFMLSRHL